MTSSSARPMAARALRQPSSASSQATAGNDSVLAKPPTKVSVVMASRKRSGNRLVSTLKAGS